MADLKVDIIKVVSTGHYVIISAEAPRYPLGSALKAYLDLKPKEDLTALMASILADFGLISWPVTGSYGGVSERALIVPVRGSAEEGALIEAAREHGQESVLHVHNGEASLWYVNGPHAVSDTEYGRVGFGAPGSGFTYGPSDKAPPEGTDHTRIDTPDGPVYFSLDVGDPPKAREVNSKLN